MAVDCLGAEMSVTEYMQGAYIYIYIKKSCVNATKPSWNLAYTRKWAKSKKD